MHAPPLLFAFSSERDTRLLSFRDVPTSACSKRIKSHACRACKARTHRSNAPPKEEHVW
jgi:hypothetical protein